MDKRNVCLQIIGWLILVIGMSVFLFVRETTFYVRLIAIISCILSFLLLTVSKKQ
jgi:hypothetical protein